MNGHMEVSAVCEDLCTYVNASLLILFFCGDRYPAQYGVFTYIIIVNCHL